MLDGVIDGNDSVKLVVSPFIAFYDMQERGQWVYSVSPKGPRTHTGQYVYVGIKMKTHTWQRGINSDS